MSVHIYPVRVGNCRFPVSYLVDGVKDDPVIDQPAYVFYIEGLSKKVLIDTGPGDPNDPNMKYHSNYFKLPEEEVGYALKKATGVDPEEIDIVIFTHLHWDHCQNNHLFKNAEFYVQISEMYDAINPCDRFLKTYESFAMGAVPIWARTPVQWRFIDGDAEIIPGVRVYHIPGHSAGSQAIMVDTEKGPFFLVGDAYPLYMHIRPDGTVIPSRLCNSLVDSYKSAKKINKIIRETNATMIPGHDAKLCTIKRFPID